MKQMLQITKKNTLIFIVIFAVFITIIFGLSAKPRNQTTSSPITHQEIRQMLEGEKAYNQAVETQYQQMPWLAKLPIDDDNFTIVYDFELRKIRIRMKQQALKEKGASLHDLGKQVLSDIGVPSNIPIDWMTE